MRRAAAGSCRGPRVLRAVPVTGARRRIHNAGLLIAVLEKSRLINVAGFFPAR
jgi:hypothetical protein